jgi:hypothetical protein
MEIIPKTNVIAMGCCQYCNVQCNIVKEAAALSQVLHVFVLLFESKETV